MSLGAEAAFRAALGDFEQRWGPPRRLLVGFSGGVDSTVLLNLCQRFDAQRTVAVHVNHGYADAARAWQTHCRGVCAQLAVPLIERELVPTGPLKEAAARRGRYGLFAELVNEHDLLLLAHHADDLVETTLLHVLQGRGVFGMPAVRQIGRGRLLRPLLQTDRPGVMACAAELEIDWLEDVSNLDVTHDRNFLRQRVLPLLRERFERLPGRLEQLRGRIQAQEDLLVAAFGLDAGSLDCGVLTGRAAGEQATLLRLWLVRHGLKPPSQRGLETFAARLDAPDDQRVVLELERGSLQRYRRAVHFVPELEVCLDRRPVRAPVTVEVPQGRLELSLAADGVQAVGELELDFYTPDAGQPATMTVAGHTRAVRELLRSHGVPPWARPGYPLLRDQRGLLLVPGIAVRDGATRGGGGVAARWTSAADWSSLRARRARGDR